MCVFAINQHRSGRDCPKTPQHSGKSREAAAGRQILPLSLSPISSHLWLLLQPLVRLLQPLNPHAWDTFQGNIQILSLRRMPNQHFWFLPSPGYSNFPQPSIHPLFLPDYRKLTWSAVEWWYVQKYQTRY